MKLPLRILNLIAAAAAAPVIVGCANDPSEPNPDKTDQNIQTEPASASEEEKLREGSDAPQVPTPPSSEPSPPVAPDQASTPLLEDAPPPEDEELPQQAEDAPLKGFRPVGGPADTPFDGGPAGPRSGSGVPGQDACPACGLG